jgi:Uncharacterized protein conserved in bacteria (DUF2219)
VDWSRRFRLCSCLGGASDAPSDAEWQLKFGVLGPASHAEDLHRDFHDLVGGDEPMGWHAQLPDEPVINIGYAMAHLAAAGRAGESAERRVVPVGIAGAGTYFTGVGVGVYGEIGWNLVDALGGTALRTGLNAASTVVHDSRSVVVRTTERVAATRRSRASSPIPPPMSPCCK